MNRLAVLVFFSLCLVACKSKKKKPPVPADSFFPVPAYLKGELARLDTSLLSFTKIETVNGRSDTTPIKNTDVRRYAKDFLELPDISSPTLKDDYEVSNLYDELQQAFVFSFMTKEPHPVRQENVTVDPEPDTSGKNRIRSIYVKLMQEEDGKPVTKVLMWEAGKGFYTTTATEVAGGGEDVKKTRVIWNGFDGQK